jgi:hypothetical protein
MSKNDTLKGYFVRARVDAGFRSEFMGTTRLVKAAFGWAAFLFALLAIGASLYLKWSKGVWVTSTPALCAVCSAVNFLIYDKMGERLAALESLDEVPGQPGDSAPSSSLERHEPHS